MRISQRGGEAALISLIRDKFGAATDADLALAIGDDAALVRCGESYMIVTTDLLVEKTHFRMDINDAYLLGWKSVAVNISDVAAMGGTPTYSFVSIGLPDVDVSVVESIYEGMYDVSNAFGSVIAGGDTVLSDCGIVINVTQLGIVEQDRAALRSGVKPGDAVIVTNALGDSLAGLQLLLKYGIDEAKRVSEFLVERHLKPEPRVWEARAAVETGKVRSMMDLSDGLSSDIRKLCEAPGVGARIIADMLPISEDMHIASARLDADPVTLAASGGEDYELLITCDAKDSDSIVKAIQGTGSSATVIGEIVDGSGAVLVSSDGSEGPLPEAWGHF